MEQLLQQLRTILSTNFGLYFKAHSFHWNIEGSDFVQYHEFLGKTYTEIFNNTDLIAEKIRTLGAYAPTSISRMIELSDITENANIPDAKSMLSELAIDNNKFIYHLRAGIIAADNANEPAIENFLQELLDQHQKLNWFLKSLIK
jgi:starvation-inducible DNA-binding protein